MRMQTHTHATMMTTWHNVYKIKKRPTNSVGPLDFHQVPLNVKLRVKGGEHVLKKLVEEETEKQVKTQEMPGEKLEKKEKKWPSQKTEKPWKQINTNSSSKMERKNG